MAKVERVATVEYVVTLSEEEARALRAELGPKEAAKENEDAIWRVWDALGRVL